MTAILPGGMKNSFDPALRMITEESKGQRAYDQHLPVAEVADSVSLSEEARSLTGVSSGETVSTENSNEMPRKTVSQILDWESMQIDNIRLTSLLGGGDAQQADGNRESDISLNASETQINALTLSASGAVGTADGARVSFDLRLEMDRLAISGESLSVTPSPEGDKPVVAYNEMSTRISRGSLDFSFSIAPVDGAEDNETGRLDIEEAVREGRKLVKPLVQNALKLDGYPQSWSLVNRLIHAADGKAARYA